MRSMIEADSYQSDASPYGNAYSYRFGLPSHDTTNDLDKAEGAKGSGGDRMQCDQCVSYAKIRV
jgi:hypothetical protein